MEKKYHYYLPIDPQFKTDIEHFIQKEQLEAEFKCNDARCTLLLNSNEWIKVMELHDFLLKVQGIQGNTEKIEEPKVAVTLKGVIRHRGLYLNYLLGREFCNLLREKNIKFTIVPITIMAFNVLHTIPVWVGKEDLSKVKKALANSHLKRSYFLEEMERNILAEN